MQLDQAVRSDDEFGTKLTELLPEVAATKADVSFVNNIQGEVQKLVQINTVVGNVDF